MPSGSCRHLSELSGPQTRLLDEARNGVLATVGSDGSPHVVPVVFVIVADKIVSPIDDKPKDERELVRVRNLRERPQATLLVHRWDEDWTKLAWVMVRAAARVELRNVAASLLKTRYPQYNDELTPGSRSIVLTPERISWWTWS